MCNRSNEKNFFNCGWEHFWCDPKRFKNYDIRELIKGPFLNSKIVYSVPYITFSQLYNTSIRLSEGIPDCWAEYLTYKLRLFREYLRKNDLMHKKCIDIIPQLRKKYRLYIGQGIPNPWTSYSYIDEYEPESPRDLSIENTDKFLCHLSHCKCLKKKLKKGLCLCCKKKYLFECPDVCDTVSNFCFHKDNHCRNTKTTNYSKNCRCNEFLKNPTLKPKKKQSQGGSSKSSVLSNSGLGAGDKNQNLKKNKHIQSYERVRTQEAYDSSSSEKSANERPFKSHNRNNVFSGKQSNVCFCPYIKSFYSRRIPRKNSAVKNFLEPTSSSKLIQAEIQPIKISRTSQTENAELKTQIKCMCSNNKCVQYNAYQCKTPWLKSCCSAAHSISCLCFPLSCPQNPAFICPYFFSNNFLCHNFNKVKSKTKKERIKRKQHREEGSDDDSNVKLKINQNTSKLDEKYDFKEEILPKITNDVLKSNRNIYYVSKYPKTFDHLKYLTDEKLKIKTEEEMSSNGMNSRVNHSPNFCRKDTSFYDLRSEKLKTYSYYKPRHFNSSVVDSAMNLQENNPLNYNIRNCNYSDQATLTKNPDNNLVDRNKVFKERIASKESKIYGLGGNRVFSAGAMRKRRKLLTNRKRRKKLTAGGKVLFLEYQALLNELPKELALTNKQVQIKESDSDCFNLGSYIFPALDTLNPKENSNLKFRNNTFQSEHITAGTWKKIDKETSSQNWNKLAGNESYEDTLMRPLHLQPQFDRILEKVSCSSGSNWSSALKLL